MAHPSRWNRRPFVRIKDRNFAIATPFGHVTLSVSPGSIAFNFSFNADQSALCPCTARSLSRPVCMRGRIYLPDLAGDIPNLPWSAASRVSASTFFSPTVL